MATIPCSILSDLVTSFNNLSQILHFVPSASLYLLKNGLLMSLFAFHSRPASHPWSYNLIENMSRDDVITFHSVRTSTKSLLVQSAQRRWSLFLPFGFDHCYTEQTPDYSSPIHWWWWLNDGVRQNSVSASILRRGGHGPPMGGLEHVRLGYRRIFQRSASPPVGGPSDNVARQCLWSFVDQQCLYPKRLVLLLIRWRPLQL